VTFLVFEIKIAVADMTTGENINSKFIMATQESFRPKELAKRNGTNMINTIPKITEIIATGLENG
jgi:hypothetical protein